MSEEYMIIAMRIFLLCGMIGHKVLWEVLKRRNPHLREARTEVPFRVTVVKSIKVMILLGLLVQAALPMEVLPIVVDASSLRIIGVMVFSLGLFIAIPGRLLLGDNWSDIEAAEVFGDHRVVNVGVYRFIRHPIYVGDLLLLYGLELALNSWLIVGVVLLTPVVLRQAIREEKKLRNTLPGYDEYCKTSKRFVPFVI